MTDAMGIIFSEKADIRLNELTEMRSVAAVPVGGRYRLIDFPLSNMVNSGIINIGVTTQHNYSSLMDHVGNGKAWDLSRKNYGLFILPPYISRESHNFSKGNVDILYGIDNYLKKSQQKYIILCEGNIMCNIDYRLPLEYHIQNKADITLIYNEEPGLSNEELSRHVILNLSEENRVTNLEVHPKKPKTHNVYMEMLIVERSLLRLLVEECVAIGEHDLNMDLLLANIPKLNILGYKFDGYVGRIDSVRSYYSNNMNLLDEDIRNEMFNSKGRIYTKVKDQVPTKYLEGAQPKNSMIADGCTIQGTVENSIIFRGVQIKKGAKVRNSIIMQDTVIGENCDLEHVVLDKDVTVRDNKRLIGQDTYPIVIGKRAVI